GSGEFSVASIRRLIDDQRLLTVDSKTLWIKSVPLKVNILAWKIKLEALPTRFNISRRGIEIDSILCPLCDCEVMFSGSILSLKCRWFSSREHVDITGTSSDVERKFTTPIEKGCRNVRRRLLPTFSSMSANASEFPASIKPHTEPAYSIENCGLPYRHCIPILTVFERFRNMSAAHVESNSMSRLGVGKRLLSNIFSPHVPVDRPEPLSPVAESISIDRNATMCVAPSEEHAAKVFGRFRNACSNDFQSFEFGIPKTGDNHG
ncbi:RNA-directed DNA polymerase, eukaryota, partial [Tanacetum coccineum]